MDWRDLFNHAVRFGFNAYEARNAVKRSEDMASSARELAERLPTTSTSTAQAPNAPETSNLAPLEAKQRTALATTEETIDELKRRLGKELYRMEMDLQGGGRIANRPCDCLSKKHTLGIEATAEELMSYEANPVYGQIVSWLRAHEAEFEPEEIAKRPPDYYQSLAPEVRRFRKQVMGTGKLGPLLSTEEKEMVAEQLDAARVVTEPMRQRAQKLADRVRAGELSRNEAVAMLADELANEIEAEAES